MGLESLGLGSAFSTVGVSIIISLILIFLAVIGGVLFIIRGGADRWRQKVPLLARANDKVDIWKGDTIGIEDELRMKDIFPITYDAVTWMEMGSRKCYIPKLKNKPFIIPPKSLTQKVMSFIQLGDDFIRVEGIELIARELVKVKVMKPAEKTLGLDTATVKGEKGPAVMVEVEEQVIVERPASYIVRVYIPELRAIMADAEMELITHAEVIRPRVNPLNQLVGYAVLGMLIFAVLAVTWFSYSQTQRAMGMAPQIVSEGMQGATKAVIEILANQTQGGRVL